MMADQTKIEWTDATWNVVNGCTLVSEGCRNCYAAELAATRLKNHPSRRRLARKTASGIAKFTGEVRFNDKVLCDPLCWKSPRKIFVCAHGDLFHENVPDDWIDQVFAVMALCPQHTFQVLTKRPERMREYLTQRAFDLFGVWAQSFNNVITPMSQHEIETHLDPCATDAHRRHYDIDAQPTFPLLNVWLGVSIEDQPTSNVRIPYLLGTPAAVRFVSAEPLLGPVKLNHMDIEHHPAARTMSAGAYFSDVLTGKNDDMGRPCPDIPKLDWVIVGGESGRNARPMHPDWARSLRDQCEAADVAFLFKQWGAWLPWEPDPAPYWCSQNGQSEDRHTLFPENMDQDPKWDDGLSYLLENTGHAVFQRVGKKAAGRLLDGVIHDEFPLMKAANGELGKAATQ